MSSPSILRRFDRELLRVGAVASAVSVFSLLYYFHRGQILLYGDAVAHINIARRVFDSQTPGLLQLGTVWLPLPHLLMIPFLLFDSLWQSGLGGSIPSMIAYVLGVAGVVRLVRGIVTADAGAPTGAHAAAWVAALVYGANPNLIYLQTTAMTESLYLALFVWAVVYACEFLNDAGKNRETTKGSKVHEGKHRVLWKGLACVVGAELTRYDGWFLAGAIGVVVAAFLLIRWKNAAFRRAGLTFLLGVSLAPALWLAYNATVYRNPWEFANGPYSARAIEQKSGAVNPAEGHVFAAGSYFLKSAQLSVAKGNWGRVWLAAAVVVLALSFKTPKSVVADTAGIAQSAVSAAKAGEKKATSTAALKRCATRKPVVPVAVPVLLLWTPLLFYGFSIAHGGVPLYIPPWWPFTWYNIRYGVQLLPLFAVSAGILVAAVLQLTKRHGSALAAVLFGLIALSYGSVWQSQPLCLTEALVNSRTRLALEGAVVGAIQPMPRQARFLMFLGNHVGVFQQAGVPLRQVVNEGNHRPWKKPSDPDGLWERALADPPQYVDYVIAFEDDEVDRGVERKNLILLSVIHVTGQARALIYRCLPNGQERTTLR